MKVSKLIESLQQAQNTYGDLPIHFFNGVGEFSPQEVTMVKAGASVQIGKATGPHILEPDRLVITGFNLW